MHLLHRVASAAPLLMVWLTPSSQQACICSRGCSHRSAAVRRCHVPLQDAVVAKQYNTDQRAFQQQARLWTQTYARKTGPQDEAVSCPASCVTLGSICYQV